MEPSLLSPTRRWAGALTLPLFFVALIVSTAADPVDDAASAGEQVRQAAGHLGRLQLTFLVELVTAALFIAAVMTVVGMVRGRGAGLANAGAVLGILGGVGLSVIATSHIYLYALAASGADNAEQVMAAREQAAGPVALLFFAAPLAIVLLCAAAARSGIGGWPLLAVTAAFLVLALVPNPAGELPGFVAGLVGFTWIALARLSAGRETDDGGPALAAAVHSSSGVTAA